MTAHAGRRATKRHTAQVRSTSTVGMQAAYQFFLTWGSIDVVGLVFISPIRAGIAKLWRRFFRLPLPSVERGAFPGRYRAGCCVLPSPQTVR